MFYKNEEKGEQSGLLEKLLNFFSEGWVTGENSYITFPSLKNLPKSPSISFDIFLNILPNIHQYFILISANIFLDISRYFL